MKNEIDKTHYCSGGNFFVSADTGDEYCTVGQRVKSCDKSPICNSYRLKWPTPEQYKVEYGEEWSDNNHCYYTHCGVKGLPMGKWTPWSKWLSTKASLQTLIVCACTPWGKPPDNWRP
jgi:hypothetical protein